MKKSHRRRRDHVLTVFDYVILGAILMLAGIGFNDIMDQFSWWPF